MAIGLIGKWSGLLFDIGRLLVALFDLLLTATTNLGADRGKSNARRRDIGQDEVSCTCRDVHDRGGRRNRCRNPTERRRSGIPPTMATSRATLVGGGLVGRGVLPLGRPSRRESFSGWSSGSRLLPMQS